MFRACSILAVLAACSQPGPSEPSNGRSSGPADDTGAPGEPSVAGMPIEIDGTLGTCDPLGVWRAKGRFPGGGDCSELPNELSLEVTVRGRPQGGYTLSLRGEGELEPDRLAAREGDCALGFRVRRGGAIIDVHALASGTGSGVWQRPDGDTPGCSDRVAFEIRRDRQVSRDARSAE